MKKTFLALILLSASINTFAYETAQTRQNWDGSATTTYSDGSTSTTRRNWDNSNTTTFSNGSTAQTRQNWDGSSTTTFN